LTLFTGIGAVAIMLIAFVLVCTATVATFRFLVNMVTGRCAHHTRVAYAAAAAASFAGIFAIGAVGLWGASALLGLTRF
jgi:hypothetical protein